MAYEARVVCDSISTHGKHRLLTVEATYPRYIHAELMTHRVFSRNASSNRAIPFSRVVQQVIDDPVIPIHWGKKARGMQAGDEVEEPGAAVEAWLTARDLAVSQASQLDRLGVHKQVVNRLLEPYQWITTIITATEWENFFSLRCHPAAQPEMQRIAGLIRDTMAASTPTIRDWHLPYITPEEITSTTMATLVPLAVARCARVSYLNSDGTYDPEKDLALYRRLIEEEPRHASPLEHVALRGAAGQRYFNLRGWMSWRYLTESVTSTTSFMPTPPD